MFCITPTATCSTNGDTATTCPRHSWDPPCAPVSPAHFLDDPWYDEEPAPFDPVDPYDIFGDEVEEARANFYRDITPRRGWVR